MDRYKQAQHDGLTEKALLNSERNDDTIRAAIDECDLIVTSWGCHAPRGPRIDVVVALTGDKRITCSCCTNYGMPWHPLYVNRNAEPIPWTPLQWSTTEPQSLTHGTYQCSTWEAWLNDQFRTSDATGIRWRADL